MLVSAGVEFETYELMVHGQELSLGGSSRPYRTYSLYSFPSFGLLISFRISGDVHRNI
jgi:hypothetical protein